MNEYVDLNKSLPYGLLDDLNDPIRDYIDLGMIRQYVRLDIKADGLMDDFYRRSKPQMARTVLTSFWQEPRIGFHTAELDKLPDKIEMGSKLLLIPWSEKAYRTFKDTGRCKGLRLEHVVPIQQLWMKLIDIEKDETTETFEDWKREAGTYLKYNYRLAVVTEDEAKGIDRYAERDKNPFAPKCPFQRYQQAINKARNAKPTSDNNRIWQATKDMDLKKFVIPSVKRR